ncbi:MAG: acyltransferase [Bacteroidetes bacterium]|nr:acyltransferase [Bacteroidota bacterium]
MSAFNAPSPLTGRRYDLDWLRVIAFSILILYHIGMFFNHWGWHVKNNELSHAIELPMRFSSQWRMSLLFMISGAAVFFALRKRSGGTFLKERAVRIFLPLVFGMFVIVPPQIFFERLTQGATFSYLDFYPSTFDFQPYPAGNFSWHHLWYLAYIFVYSVVGLPLLLYIRKQTAATARLARLSANPLWLIGLPVLWHWGGQLLLGPHFPTTNALLDDWNQHFHYFTLFVTGYVLCSQTQFWTSLLHQRRLTLALALVLTTVLYAVYWTTDYDPEGWELSLYFLIATTNAWCILLTIFGHGYRYLHFPNRFLTYANEAVYPFYILHQTVIVCLAYPLIDLTLPMEVKFVYLSFATFVICWVLYHFLIKRVSVLRVLLGMKGLEKKVVAKRSVEGVVV